MQYQILVVEDQPEIRTIVEKYLRKEGYAVQGAANGFEALELFNESTVHLVLLDVMMPGIDGFEVLREIRKLSEVPVVMLTARQGEVDRVRGFRAGVDDYVVKPFSAKELMLRVRRLLTRVYHEADEPRLFLRSAASAHWQHETLPRRRRNSAHDGGISSAARDVSQWRAW